MTTWLCALTGAFAQEASIEVRADQVLHPVSRYLTGACLEDVNHEIYGGLYSQMIFGESFQEPAAPLPLTGFTAYGGHWTPRAGELLAEADDDGPKLICAEPAFAEGEVNVEVFFPEKKDGNAGLIVKVSQPGQGADSFSGYEVALDTSGRLVLGRHRQNWEPIRTVPCQVPTKEWLRLSVRTTETSLEVRLNDKMLTQFEDTEHPLRSGSVGLRTWQRDARFRNLAVTTAGVRHAQPFELAGRVAGGEEVSGRWRPMQAGEATGDFTFETNSPLVGRQSQRITFVRGHGQVGVENQGLNRWGMHFENGKPYEGLLWARAEAPTDLFVTLENQDGSVVLAEKELSVKGGDWQRLTFALKPDGAVDHGRFAVTLRKPGSVTLGYAFLQPGGWGRFKGLPVRRDVAEGLISQGITVLRYGGSMINDPEYRWKKMIGPRDQRPPYRGTWYPQSSNGWGIPDFMDFCEAAGFEYVPAFNLGETAQDMADFIEYAKGPASSKWGRKRVADGHPAPYRLKYIELGNEERVDENYWRKFKPMAEAIWAKDPEIILVVGDFFYDQVIQDPFNFEGGAVRTLAAQKKILDLAQEHDREVWFDIHIGTGQPPAPGDLAGERSFIDQLARICPGAKYKVVIFEFNANNHAQKRALANALAIQAVERDGRIPIATSANCLQPDGQNDNGWDQGLLFLNPSKVWLQPPGYVTQMFSRNFQPQLVQCEVTGVEAKLEVNAKRSADGKTLVLQAVNPTDKAVPAQIHLAGFVPRKAAAQATELCGPLNALNTAAKPDAVVPVSHSWRHHTNDGATHYTFAPYSVTVLRFE